MGMYFEEGKSFEDSLTLRKNKGLRNALKMVKTKELSVDVLQVALKLAELEELSNYCHDRVRENVQDKDFNARLGQLTNNLVESYLLNASTPDRLKELNEKAEKDQMDAMSCEVN